MHGGAFIVDPRFGGQGSYNYIKNQMDSLRCYLLYIPINISKYLVDISAKPKDQVNPDEVFNFVIHKLKLLKFGIQCLTKNDMHAKQLEKFVMLIKNMAKPVLDAYGITADFDFIYESTFTTEDLRTSDLDESKLSEKAQKVTNFNVVNYEKLLDPLVMK